MGDYGLGVDLGTTWTAAAVMRAGGEPHMLSLAGRSVAAPTVVHIAADGTPTVGEAAERRALTEANRFAREFKRRLGDTAPILLGGQPWSPEALLTMVLGWVVRRASEQEGGSPAAMVVTHPANWGPLRRELLAQAVEHAGLVASFATEPEAAAIDYAAAARVPAGTVVAVYDLGGGTFDATVLRKTDDGFEVIGWPQGVERLGGLDFDAAVFGHVTGLLGPAWTELDRDDPTAAAAAARLREECVRAKEALSEDPDVTIAAQLPTVATHVRLTRGEFEAMIRPSIEQSAMALERAIAAAGLSAEQIDRVLLVGGSSRIPLVSEVLANRLGRPLALDAHPKHAVAQGAARLAVRRRPAVLPEPSSPVWSSPVAPPPVSEPEAPAAAADGSVPLTLEPAGKDRRSRKGLLAAAVGVVAAVALIAGVVLAGGDGDGDGDGSEDFARSDESGDEVIPENAAVIVTLEWPSSADIDLSATNPDGDDLETIGDDTNESCSEEGGFEQAFTPPDDAPPGTYTVFVFGAGVDDDLCGAGDYTITVETPEGEQEFTGTIAVEETQEHTFDVSGDVSS